MKYKENLVLGELVEWLKTNTMPMYESLNDGSRSMPPSWPKAVQNYYLLHNGQSKDSIFLFPKLGNWLSVEDALVARQQWLDWAEDFDWEDWYKEEYIPIVAYMDQMIDATVVNIKTGEIGNVDYELQEFELLFDNIDDLFADLLNTLKKEGYPPEETYVPQSKEQIDSYKLKEASDAEDKFRQTNSNPSPEELFEWAKTIFRHQGDPKYGEPNLHMMRLSKKYFDQILPNTISSKQIREVAVFNQRYKQLISS